MIGKFVFIDGGNNAEREEYETSATDASCETPITSFDASLPMNA